MSYPEFRELIFEALKEMIPEDITVKPVSAEKTNSFVRYGIMFERTGVNYVPTVYLEPFYRSYQKGYSIEYLAKELYDCYLEEIGPAPDLLHVLNQFDSAREHIFAKMIHIEENKRLLAETPHRTFLDFAIVPYYEVDEEQCYKGSVLLNEIYLSCWEMDADALLDWAIQNTKDTKGVLICPMGEVIDGFLPLDDEEIWEYSMNELYVLTNQERYFGAVLVYFPEVLEAVRQKLKGDYYLLPSSVHEWIAVSASQVTEKELLFDMVKNVNETEVLEEEVLSNNIYYYSASLQKIYVYRHINDKND